MIIQGKTEDDFPMYDKNGNQVGTCSLVGLAIVMEFKDELEVFETFQHFKDAENVAATER